jgi:hypothetical protein
MRATWIALLALVLTACASQREPAQQAIAEISALVSAASADATRYVPEQLMDVQNQMDKLRAAFDRKDYALVLADAPAVRDSAQALAAAAAAKKDQLAKALNEQWTALARELPDQTTAIRNRLDLLGKSSNKKMAAGIDLEAAKARLSGAESLWSKAQAAFATGNLAEAVATAGKFKAEIDSLSSTLKMDLPAAVQVKVPTSPR